MAKSKFECVVLDTINQIQNDLYIDLLEQKGKATYDDWKDYGVEILQLLHFIKKTGAVPVLVLGYEGSGKTMGADRLNPSTTLYINADKKPLVLSNRDKYIRGENYAEPTTYADVKGLIQLANESKGSHPLIIFIMGHIETYRGTEGEIRERLKVLGKMATKLNIEGSVVHCYYTQINSGEEDPANHYRLTTANSGYNTARAPYGYFEEYTIPNNLQTVLEKIKKDEFFVNNQN